MTKNAQRLSQVVSTFGPGAMIDLPTRSVIVAGLEFWNMRSGAFETIAEPRLTARLEAHLKALDLIPDTVRLSLRTPPVSTSAPGQVPQGVDAPVFPAWFVCERAEQVGSDVRRRRLVRWQDLDPRGRRQFVFDDGKKSEVTPIRFVAACQKGHLQDIDWRRVVHEDVERPNCREPMWLEEKGTSADPADTSVVCNCRARLSLRDAFTPGRLGQCFGKRPWLLDQDPNGCGQPLKLLTRTATNTYFPQVYTVISLPSEEDELTRLVSEIADKLRHADTPEAVGQARLFNDMVAATLEGYSDADVFDRLARIREAATAEAGGSPKIAEFDVFASGRPTIGQNNPTAKLYAETLPREAWEDPDVGVDLSAIRSLVAVHRLREVSCLYGFTRFEAAPTSADGDLEDVSLAVEGSPLSKGSDWLPAVEQFGEGLFIHFDAAAVEGWLNQPAVVERHDKLSGAYTRWQQERGGSTPDYPGTPYVLLHSLSHALMAEIALECGYPASSLKERIYALTDPVSGVEVARLGILIYTSTPGAQGTLGGLVAAAPRFSRILVQALERQRVCSNDPVCADHEPDTQSGDRATHGAACHSCLLIAETSCEMRNLLLDRSLLVPTMAASAAAFLSRT
ncbi:MAG: DUF1998 domain-containing protein [bacterium]|nr:DUF1998 domain-containing protein [bacterium]